MQTFNERFAETVLKRNSNLCVGLDPDLTRMRYYVDQGIPGYCPDMTQLSLSCRTVEDTFDYAAAYKPNAAFWENDKTSEAELVKHIRSLRSDTVPPILIYDGKRGDILNTSKQYAKNYLSADCYDAITVNPLMGSDSVLPFLENPTFGVFVLCLTSNKSADEILIKNDLYLHIADLAANKWNGNNNIGLVVGATRPEYLSAIRDVAPDLPLLIPGVGVQGGNLSEIMDAMHGKENKNFIINASRSIMFPSAGISAIAREAQTLRDEIYQLER